MTPVDGAGPAAVKLSKPRNASRPRREMIDRNRRRQLCSEAPIDAAEEEERVAADVLRPAKFPFEEAIGIVEDIVDGILRCAINPDATNQSFNLASGVETKVIDVAELINKLTENPSGTTSLPLRDWDKITRRRASIEKSKKIGYSPQTRLQQGLERTIKWMRANLERIDRVARL